MAQVTLLVVLISAGFDWFRLVYVSEKKLKEAEKNEANGVNVLEDSERLIEDLAPGTRSCRHRARVAAGRVAPFFHRSARSTPCLRVSLSSHLSLYR